jgi:phospholipase C
MYKLSICFAAPAFCLVLFLINCNSDQANGSHNKVNHIIIIMQENRSFDSYFGVLAYASASPYHNGNGPCRQDDQTCVDGLSCTQDATGNLTCSNSNLDDDGSTVFAFHNSNYCVSPDLDHSWPGSHKEANFLDPSNTLLNQTPNDGFVRVNDTTEQLDNGVENPTEDETMGFYNESDLPFYYNLAENFAINDSYFASVLGPTFPNRSYLMSATSFGHLSTAEIIPPLDGYKPITGTIFDLLDQNNISWVDYFSDFPQVSIFRTPIGPNFLPISFFFQQVQAGQLPAVVFIDSSFTESQFINGSFFDTDEHPPADIRAGQFFVSQVLNAVRKSPIWKDSIIFITYDEHGGFYDHVTPPRTVAPDQIAPGQCADLSNSPASQQPGGGANCDTSRMDAQAICSAFTSTGLYPPDCPNFNQLGFRVPFIAVSPFSKPHYVSHTVGDHTSILALIEKLFLGGQHLTERDLQAQTLEDMFDFDHAPSLNTEVPEAPLPSSSDCR